MERSNPVLAYHPANQVLLDYLKTRARRPNTPISRTYALDGWELHTHPDLLERFEKIAPDDAQIIPLFGVPALAANGIAAAAALGTGWLMVRLPQLPNNIETKDPILPLTDHGWHAVSAWQSGTPSTGGKRRLTHLLNDALHHARTLNP
ncbi:hypothetical protein [Actinomadura sp. 9N215]|uniref:hypothetical protein n=1 Tax=Actinomadura sp. 9N215 TaxID=3375150 RepID=UPI0037A7121E